MSDTAMPDYMARLNPEQQEAARAPDGPTLALAGAGTGKTAALTARLAWLLEGGIQPWEIMAVTFTNRAARELRERVALLIGADRAKAMTWLGTFHGLGAKVLRRYAEDAGLDPNFAIIDRRDGERLARQVIVDMDLDPTRDKPPKLAGLIDAWKNQALTPQNLTPTDNARFAFDKGREAYMRYERLLRARGCADFGDLVMLPLRLWQERDDIRDIFRRRLRHVMVDEYQDVNPVQDAWLPMLTDPECPNLFCVGDDDQSIYGWRGADVKAILAFKDRFPGARIIRLERNYRSTGRILEAANQVLRANIGRLGKTLRPVAGQGSPVQVAEVRDDIEEARAALDAIETKVAQGARYGDVGVLVRASRQMRAFEQAFMAAGAPYRVSGGPRFYERAEARCANAYLRLAAADDDVAFTRAVNEPPRGVGVRTQEKLAALADAERISFVAAALNTSLGKGRGFVAARAFAEQARAWQERAAMLTPAEVFDLVMEESGYLAHLRTDPSLVAEGRAANLDEMREAMENFASLREWLEHVALATDRPEDDAQTDNNHISLMTIHAAKGLEFRFVFLPGWEEGLFPSAPALNEGPQALEEERRLAHVALTRAKEEAVIFYARRRQVYGRWENCIPSRFLHEIVQAGQGALETYAYTDRGTTARYARHATSRRSQY